MKNYVQDDDVVTVTAPAAVSSGDGVLVGSVFGVAVTDAAINTDVAIAVEGVFDLVKASGETWTEGQAIYWHNGTVKQASNSSSGNTKIGVALKIDGVMPGSSDLVGRVRLNGSF